MTRTEALAETKARLASAGVETPDTDSKRLLLHAENISQAALIADPDAVLTERNLFLSFIERRIRREPVAKITGYKDFWSYRFQVNGDVLDPRPDTETLIEAAFECTGKAASLRIADLGTGSGCILLTLLAKMPHATGLGLDISPGALKVAKTNAKMLNLDNRSQFIAGDWLSALDETFDLVVSNPPYIPVTEGDMLAPEVIDWEPHTALFAGMDGLQAYREIANGLSSVLKSDGTAIFEVGYNQAKPVMDLFKKAGFRRISSRTDLGGIERCIIVQR